MTVTIPTIKMDEFVKECSTWLNKRKASKKAIQSLVGKMLFISNCVTQGRRFMSRVLGALRAMGDREWTTLSEQFRLDVKWFVSFAKVSNGVALISPTRSQAEIECDSSLTGAGGVAGSFCYTWKYSSHHLAQFKKVHELEAVNIIVAFRTLAPRVAAPGALVTIWTDNSSSAYALETGRTKDAVLAACARELWLLAAANSQVVTVCHKPGSLIPLSDALSRCHEDQTKAHYVKANMYRENLQMISPVTNDYVFFDPSL